MFCFYQEFDFGSIGNCRGGFFKFPGLRQLLNFRVFGPTSPVEIKIDVFWTYTLDVWTCTAVLWVSERILWYQRTKHSGMTRESGNTIYVYIHMYIYNIYLDWSPRCPSSAFRHSWCRCSFFDVVFHCRCFFSMSFFILFRSFSGSILSSQANPPTIKHLDFPQGFSTCLKQQRLKSKHGFENSLGLSLAHLGSSWASLGGFWGPLHRPQKASRFLFELSWASFARFCLLLLVYVRSSFFDVVFYPLSMSLGIDFELPSRPPDPQKPWLSGGNLNLLKNQRFPSKNVFERVLVSLGRVLGEFRAPLRASWSVLAYLGASWGRLGLDFRSKGWVDCGRSSWMPFSNWYPSDVAPKIDPRSLNKNL